MASSSYSKCIEDLLMCYNLSERTLSDVLFETIVLAIDQGMNSWHHTRT